VLEGQQMVAEGAEADEQQAALAAEDGDTGKQRRRTGADNAGSATTTTEPGREAENATDTGAAAPNAETQVSVPGNQGFGKTGQQPDSVGDHPQAGTGAPVAGATGGGDDEAEIQPSSSPEQDKGAESVGVAS
jgi:hypothetical protein